jgi:hypothetical protein
MLEIHPHLSGMIAMSAAQGSVLSIQFGTQEDGTF